MIRIAICDDDANQGKALEKSVADFIAKNNINAQIKLYEHSQNLHFDVEDGAYYDLILSDIKMPDMDGMQLAKSIREFLPNALIVFITSYTEFAIDAYELSVFRYIPKSHLKERLEHALKDAVGIIQLQQDQYYAIVTSTRVEKIALKDIICIRREGKNALFSLVGGKHAKERKSLSDIYKALNPDDFLFLGRGDIVNIIHVVSLKNGTVHLKNETMIPVNPSTFNEIKEKLNVYWGKVI